MYPHVDGGPQSPILSLQRRSTLLALVCVLALAAGACTGDGLGDDEAAVLRSGSVEVAEGQTWRSVDTDEPILVGSSVRSGRREAVLEFRGATVRLAPHSEATVAEDAMEVTVGEVLVDGSLDVAMQAVDLTGSGVYRVSVRPSPTLRVYDGVATASASSAERRVPALRQLALDGRHLPARPQPLRYLPSDTWDAELLADAIAFDEEAARTLAGLQLLVGRGAKSASFFARYLDDELVRLISAAASRVSGGRYGPAGDVLLALVIVAAADPTYDNARELLFAVRALRDAGARWGLIAMQLGVDYESVVAVLDARQGRRVALARQAGEPSDPDTAAASSDDGSDGDDPPPTPSDAPGESPGPPSGGSPGPAPAESDPGDDPGGTDETEQPEEPGGDDEPDDPGDPEDPDDPDDPGTGNDTIDRVVEDVTREPDSSADPVSSTVDAVLDSEER